MNYAARSTAFFTAMALFAMILSCGQKKNPGAAILCIIGPDTLSMARADRLVPDSLPRSRKTMRAALELSLVNAMHKKTRLPDSQAIRRIAADLSEQLSRQTTDAWTTESAWYLYNAVTMVYGKMRDTPASSMLSAYIDSLFSATVVVRDSMMKKEPLVVPAFQEIAAISTGKIDQLDIVVSRLFFLPSVVSRIVSEFVTTAEVPSNNAANMQMMVKGLVFDSTRRKKAIFSKTAPASPAIALHGDAKEALKYRSQSSIKDSIEKHIPDLEALYKKNLKVHQSLAGTIWVTFQITPDGTITSARIKTSKITEKDFLFPFHNYILERVRFKPVPEKFGTMAIEFPFEFTPEN